MLNLPQENFHRGGAKYEKFSKVFFRTKNQTK